VFVRFSTAYYALIALAATEIALAIALGRSGLWQLLSSNGLPLMIVLIGGLFPLIWITGVALAITHRRVDRPISAIGRMILAQKAWLLRGIFLATVVIIFARGYSSFKSSISRLNPFWADHWLAELDYRTFGIDPWRLSHAVFGPTATLIIDRLYILWFFMMFLSLGWFCFTRNPKLQIRGLLSYLLSWSLLGGVAAVAFSSVGPCFYQQFYGDDRFAPLVANLNAVNADTPLFAVRSMKFLIDSLGVDRFGSGISAMPSLHVTIAMLSFLATLTYSRSRALKVISGLFAACILVGSVHLGWHYAWDGFFGILAVTLIWWSSGRFVDWVEARELAQQARAGFKPPRAKP
jgi:hypothetical protein